MSINTSITEVVTVSDTRIHVITAGTRGPAGVAGAAGATGPAGANGTNGTNGTNGVGVPSGGSTGQVLKKQSATHYDTIWQNEAGGSPGGSSGQVQYNNAGAFGGAAAFAYAASGTHLTVTATGATDKPFAAKAAASQTANIAECQSSAGSAYFYVGPPTLAGDSATKNFVNLTATMPSSASTTVNGVNILLTSAGSYSSAVVAQNIALSSGYTGNGTTAGLIITNSAAGTGAGYAAGSSTNSYRLSTYNGATYFTANATTSGINCATRAMAHLSSTANYAAWNTATSNGNSAALNIGTASFALGATTNCAGFFALADYGSSAPTFANCALIADNGASGADIFQARANGTAAVKVDGSGRLFPIQATTAGAPSYVKGALYFDTTLNKLRIGGVSGWETITSS